MKGERLVGQRAENAFHSVEDINLLTVTLGLLPGVCVKYMPCPPYLKRKPPTLCQQSPDLELFFRGRIGLPWPILNLLLGIPCDQERHEL